MSLTRGQGVKTATTDDHQSSNYSEDVKPRRKSSMHNHSGGRNNCQVSKMMGCSKVQQNDGFANFWALLQRKCNDDFVQV